MWFYVVFGATAERLKHLSKLITSQILLNILAFKKIHPFPPGFSLSVSSVPVLGSDDDVPLATHLPQDVWCAWPDYHATAASLWRFWPGWGQRAHRGSRRESPEADRKGCQQSPWAGITGVLQHHQQGLSCEDGEKRERSSISHKSLRLEPLMEHEDLVGSFWILFFFFPSSCLFSSFSTHLKKSIGGNIKEDWDEFQDWVFEK